MKDGASSPIGERMTERIARCRFLFSSVTLAAMLLDPMRPAWNPWATASGAPGAVSPGLLGVVAAHWVYSLSAYVAVTRARFARWPLPAVGTWADVLVGGAIAFATDGKSTLLAPFFTFAIVATGLQAGFHRTIRVTTVTAAVWLGLVAIADPETARLHVMRPVYLLIVGYLVGYLGQQRVHLEEEIRHFEADERRVRIARDLHDGCTQVFAAVSLYIEAALQQLRRGRAGEALAQLTELQASVSREHDNLRAYVRALAGIERPAPVGPVTTDTRFSLRVDLDGSGDLVEQVLRIIGEGIVNVRRHAHARSAAIRVRGSGPDVHILIDDDGAGIQGVTAHPWSISSRVRDLGGTLRVRPQAGPGTHLAIALRHA